MSAIHLEILRDVATNLETLSRTLSRNTMPTEDELARYQENLHLSARTLEVISTTVHK